MGEPPRISVLGLGYVGLPLAVALAAHYPVTGFDVKAGRIQEIAKGLDRTGEVDEEALKSSRLEVTADAEALRGSDVFIVTVPTPVDSENQPDLGALQIAQPQREHAPDPVHRGAGEEGHPVLGQAL